jgi:hypothetical protein
MQYSGVLCCYRLLAKRVCMIACHPLRGTKRIVLCTCRSSWAQQQRQLQQQQVRTLETPALGCITNLVVQSSLYKRALARQVSALLVPGLCQPCMPWPHENMHSAQQSASTPPPLSSAVYRVASKCAARHSTRPMSCPFLSCPVAAVYHARSNTSCTRSAAAGGAFSSADKHVW